MGNEEKKNLFYDKRGDHGLPLAAHEHRARLERLNVSDPYELRAIVAEQRAELDEADGLAKKILAYEAGQDAAPREEGVVLSPAQLWHKLLNATEDMRTAMLTVLCENAKTAYDCFAQDHGGALMQLEADREALSAAVFGSPTLGSTSQLHTAVRALRSVMVDGIAAREPRIEYAEAEPSLDDLSGFPEEPDVREKIGAQLKSAGIDLSSICGYEWTTTLDEPDSSICTNHACSVVNPLHIDSHECASCSAELTHIEAEQLAEAGQ